MSTRLFTPLAGIQGGYLGGAYPTNSIDSWDQQPWANEAAPRQLAWERDDSIQGRTQWTVNNPAGVEVSFEAMIRSYCHDLVDSLDGAVLLSALYMLRRMKIASTPSIMPTSIKGPAEQIF